MQASDARRKGTDQGQPSRGEEEDVGGEAPDGGAQAHHEPSGHHRDEPGPSDEEHGQPLTAKTKLGFIHEHGDD